MDLKWYLICLICSPLWSDLACMYALEKEMATDSSALAWRIPETEEPGGLPSMGSHRFGHDWSDLAAAAAAAMISDVEYIFMCLLPSSLSSLEYYLFKSFAHFKLDLLLTCKSSLYFIAIYLLSSIWVSNIFSHSVSCLCTLLIVLFDTQNFKFWWRVIYLFICCLCFWCPIQGVIAKFDAVKLLPYSFFWEFCSFHSYV